MLLLSTFIICLFLFEKCLLIDIYCLLFYCFRLFVGRYADKDIKAVVFSSAKPDNFIAGADIDMVMILHLFYNGLPLCQLY